MLAQSDSAGEAAGQALRPSGNARLEFCVTAVVRRAIGDRLLPRQLIGIRRQRHVQHFDATGAVRAKRPGEPAETCPEKLAGTRPRMAPLQAAPIGHVEDRAGPEGFQIEPVTRRDFTKDGPLVRRIHQDPQPPGDVRGGFLRPPIRRPENVPRDGLVVLVQQSQHSSCARTTAGRCCPRRRERTGGRRSTFHRDGGNGGGTSSATESSFPAGKGPTGRK